MAPEYETFIADYRKYLLADVEVLVDMLDDALRNIHRTGHDLPQAIENWDAFLTLLRTPVPFKVKLWAYDKILKSGFIEPKPETAQ